MRHEGWLPRAARKALRRQFVTRWRTHALPSGAAARRRPRSACLGPSARRQASRSSPPRAPPPPTPTPTPRAAAAPPPRPPRAAPRPAGAALRARWARATARSPLLRRSSYKGTKTTRAAQRSRNGDHSVPGKPFEASVLKRHICATLFCAAVTHKQRRHTRDRHVVHTCSLCRNHVCAHRQEAEVRGGRPFLCGAERAAHTRAGGGRLLRVRSSCSNSGRCSCSSRSSACGIIDAALDCVDERSARRAVAAVSRAGSCLDEPALASRAVLRKTRGKRSSPALPPDSVEVRVTPLRTEIIIRATRTQNVLGARRAPGCRVVAAAARCAATSARQRTLFRPAAAARGWRV